ncbi:MAG: hypothetical protein WDW36_007437 [Sanguina aurantia]
MCHGVKSDVNRCKHHGDASSGFHPPARPPARPAHLPAPKLTPHLHTPPWYLVWPSALGGRGIDSTIASIAKPGPITREGLKEEWGQLAKAIDQDERRSEAFLATSDTPAACNRGAAQMPSHVRGPTHATSQEANAPRQARWSQAVSPWRRPATARPQGAARRLMIQK